ncbi:MAG: phosphocholine cytidylyltransferase family protein [Bacteroides sp.]|jgi:choline kinase|uniref:Nucleotidyl transferase domain-containing protein n=1 Tax=Phocaeicola sartorii TaxID=671267 RepID=R9IC56_9BACT|nr:phosphocholine cytidylyltransferase family protein [Phocaeicola sartorii]EOS14909.1 hypothetical protein C802_00926 [Phocaeicola sartorii]MBO5506798.1 phosphocholine cytidylyltransferase family protein [Bacteroides sp.]MCR1846676.1 phosphocholine cytidylyltransferase family protein [Phocaeicola sartorii]NUL01305.1 phosphocholine cytidylyltransferase family protein [Phocaeicola sartorii]
MKAIILAAGLGTRLRPITDEVPKCMVPVNGVCIIDKQISNLHKHGITDIVVVGGYKADMLKKHLSVFPDITFIDNIRYAETNNMYSLYLVFQAMEQTECLLMNADVYYDDNIIAGLLSPVNKGISMIACDDGGYIEESMKITLDGKGSINHINKKITEEEYDAVSIDVYKLNEHAVKTLAEEVKNVIEIQGNTNSWTEVALDAIFDVADFKPYVIEGRWFEIDNHEDLHTAEKLFEGDEI